MHEKRAARLVVVGYRATDDELVQLRQSAKRHNLNLSDYIRHCIEFTQRKERT